MANNIITIETDIYEISPGGEKTGEVYMLTIKLQGEEISLESVVEEIRARVSEWALTWLRLDCTISMKQKRGG